MSVIFGARETDEGEPRQAPGIKGVEIIRGELMTRRKRERIGHGRGNTSIAVDVYCDAGSFDTKAYTLGAG